MLRLPLLLQPVLARSASVASLSAIKQVRLFSLPARRHRLAHRTRSCGSAREHLSMR